MSINRGRPREFDRDAALANAAKLFWSKGYEATSLSDLKKVMGIGSPSLYAAFHSKESLYAESLEYYRKTYDDLVWSNFGAAATARGAVQSFLLDSAAALTGQLVDIPKGCMMVLSSVGSEGHKALGEIVRAARAATVDRLEARFMQGITDGDLPEAVDVHALARLVQTIQSGMSILARDEVTHAELRSVAELAIAGWDSFVTRSSAASLQA